MLSFKKDVQAYVKGCDVCLALKTVRHKPYNNLQTLLISTLQWKIFSMDFIIRLPVSINWKSESYNFILVIVDRLLKIVYYKPINVTINAPVLAEVIFDVVVSYYGVFDSFVSNKDLLFTCKFWSSLCYIFVIKRRLSTALHSQTNGQTKQLNSTIEAYFWSFLNFK